MTLVWHPIPKEFGIEATGETGIEYRIIRTTVKFWFSSGDIDCIGRKGNKSQLQKLAQTLEDERCSAVGL